MQFAVFLLSSLSIGSVLGQGVKNSTGTAGSPNAPSLPASSGAPKPPGDTVKVHVVKVGANGAIKFEPNKLTAAVGDMVQFQFAGGNHTVSQSSFDAPCAPVSMVDPKVIGFYSGYMPVSAESEMLPTYTVMVNNLTPIWIYCAQGQHCQKGMNMVINENVKANATRSLENFSALAAKSTTVQMVLGTDGSPDGSPAGKPGGSPAGKPGGSPSGSIGPKATDPSRPNGAPSKPGSKDESSKDGGSKPDSSDPSPPITSSGIKIYSITVSVLVGSLAFAIVL